MGLLRIASADADAAAMLRQGLMGGGLSRLVEALHVPRPEVRTALVGSALFRLGMARYVIRIEPIASAPVEAVAGWYGPTLQRYPTGPLE